MKNFRPAKQRVKVTIGESVRIVRELQELTQVELARMTGIPPSTISAIEGDRIRLSAERARLLAHALRCHPTVLMFPGWDGDLDSAA